MKSRYSAYAYEKIDYILKTTFGVKKDTEQSRLDILSFCKDTDFRKLDIYDFTDSDLEAFVTFRATLQNSRGDCSFSEKSKFIYQNKRWQYVDGEIF